MATDVDSLGPLHQIELPEGPIAYHERGNGPPLVFVHGIIANADVWRHVVLELADRFRCLHPGLAPRRPPAGNAAGHRLLPVRSGRPR